MIKLSVVDKKDRPEVLAAGSVKVTPALSFEKELAGADMLGNAFLSFNDAAKSLERHYSYLEEKVAALDRELLSKSIALEESLKKVSDMERYQANILKNLPSGVVVQDISGEVKSYNKSAGEITGCFNLEMLAGRMKKLVPESNSSGCFSPFESEREIVHINDDGKKTVLKIQTRPFWDDAGSREGTLYILNDITKEKSLEKSLAQSKKLAAMGEMAAQLAHEIRNPLGGIELLASSLNKSLSNSFGRDVRARKMAADICSGVASLNQIVSNTLQFAKVERPEMIGMNPCETIEDALISAMHLIERAGIEINKDFLPSLSLIGNRDLMQQVFLNIILNAVQAMEGGGRLTITMEKSNDENQGKSSGGKIRIIFKDTGPGMPNAVKDSAFKAFYSTKARGSGLGLAIVHNIIDAHKGKVEIESEMGEGTTVSIVLPAKS